MNMPVDRVSRHLTSLRGNQMAEALASAGLVKKPEPPPVDERALLADIRAWLARLVAGQRVPSGEMSPRLQSKDKRQEIVNRLKERGLITVKTGMGGGAMASQRLVELARVNIGDDELRVLTMQDVSEDERATVERELSVPRPVVETAPGPARRVSRYPALPEDKLARDAEIVNRVRAWLENGAGGAPLYIAEIGLGNSSVYRIAYSLRDAGYIERRDDGGTVYYVVPDVIRDHVRSLTDDQIAGFIWPGRAARMAREAETVSSNVVEALVDATQRSNEAAAALRTHTAEDADQQPPDALSLLAERMLQFLTVLERVNARLSRLEREWGLCPLEEETSR